MEIKNRVVVGYKNGKRLKGFTFDFTPGKEIFHVTDPQDDRKITEVSTNDLKAVFCVKTFEGDRRRKSDYALENLKKVPGLKLKVTFLDGEVLYGTTNGYTPGRRNFFLLPADKNGNNERVCVFSDFARSIEPIP